MFQKVQNHITLVIQCMFFLLCLISPAFMAEGHDDLYSEENIEAIMEKIKPLIEEVTGRKYSSSLECRITTRDEIYDVLFEEIFPQLKKYSKEDDDSIARLAETQAFNASQALLGKYSFLTKQFYLVPNNIKSVSRTLELEDKQLEEFVFLIITHERKTLTCILSWAKSLLTAL